MSIETAAKKITKETDFLTREPSISLLSKISAF